MLKSDLVNILVAQKGLSQRQAEQAVEHIFDAMKAELIKGQNIEIRGFGAFHVKFYKGYRGRNPKTSQTIEVRPKRGVLFRTGKELRERVNNPTAVTPAVSAPVVSTTLAEGEPAAPPPDDAKESAA